VRLVFSQFFLCTFEAQIDLNNGGQDEMKRGIAEHTGWAFQFA
jgi:hypothetical protein